MEEKSNKLVEIMNNKIIFSIIIAFAFAFNITLFAPLEFFYLNVFDLWFSIDYVLPYIIMFFSLIFLLIFLVSICTKGKVHSYISKIIFSIFIGLYIQGNFMNMGYTVLDGSKIDWNSMIFKGIINTIIWLAIIILPFVIKWFKNEKNFKKFAVITSIFITLIEIITLIVISSSVYYSSEAENMELDRPFCLEKTNIFNLSKKENIIVFVSDSFEGTYMNQLLESHPEYKELLKDFTYFDNTTSAATVTYGAMPTILTGEVCSVNKNLKQNIKQCFDDTKLYPTLIKNGYDIELYTDVNLLPYEDKEVISNKVDGKMMIDTESKQKLSYLLMDCVFYKYLPHFLKSNFIVNSSEFNKVNAEHINQYVIDDVKFNKELISDGIKTNNENSTYKLYHLNGPHEPFTVNQDIEYDYSEEYYLKPDSEKRENQVIASIKILLNYVEELKKAEIYDNTTIILLADHGWENRYYANFLIKNANEDKEFSISHAPIAINEDLIPTILNTVTNSKEYGKDIWDYEEEKDKGRERKIYNYIFTGENNTYGILYKEIIIIKGTVSDERSYCGSQIEFGE